LAACGVVLPPTPVSQTNSVIQATNTIVVAVNSQTSTVAPGGTPVGVSSATVKPSDSKQGAGDTNADAKTDTKADAKTDSKDGAKDEYKVIKNDPIKKLYCN
jgi:hypothetical protein